MFLRLFRTHANIQLIVFFIVSILLWADGFYNMLPAIHGDDTSPLYNLIFGWLMDIPFLATLLAFLLLLIEALILNNSIASCGICSKNNYLPATIFMVLFSYSPAFLRMYPVIPANLLLIFAMRMIWNAQLKEKPYQDLFTASILVSLASLFDVYYIVFIPVVWISLIIYRNIAWREWFIVLLGLMTPLLYASFVLFWNDHLIDTGLKYMMFFRNIRIFPADYRLDYMIYIICGIIFLISLTSFFRFLNTVPEKVINIRRVSMTVVWMFVLSIISVLVINKDPMLSGSCILLPLSVFIAAWLQTGKKNFWREVFLLLLTGSIIAGKFLL